MPKKAELLLIGRLFGAPDAELKELFELRQIDDFTPVQDLPGVTAQELRAVAVGMVGSGHVSTVAVDSAFLDGFPSLEIVAVLGVGCDHIDIDAAYERGITITNTPDVNTEEVADTAMGMLLGTVRQVPQADRFLRAGRWPGGMFPLSATLRGKRLGILGLGRIGKAVARRAEGFGLEILYHGRKRQPGVSYAYAASTLELARAVDFLMVIVPGGEETRNLVDGAVLQALGPEGVLLNVSRGTVVDEAALIAALENKVIAAAGLDAYVHEPYVPAELMALEQVVLLPHIGSGTHHTREMMSRAVVDNLKQWNQGLAVNDPVLPGQQT